MKYNIMRENLRFAWRIQVTNIYIEIRIAPIESINVKYEGRYVGFFLAKKPWGKKGTKLNLVHIMKE